MVSRILYSFRYHEVAEVDLVRTACNNSCVKLTIIEPITTTFYNLFQKKIKQRRLK